MLAKEILEEIEAARAAVKQLESDIRMIRGNHKDWEEGIEKDERASIKALHKLLIRQRDILSDLELTDWERPVKMKGRYQNGKLPSTTLIDVE